MRSFSKIALALIVCIAGTQASAQISEQTTTANDRQSVNITVYNSNLGLVRETRRLNLPAGRIALLHALAHIELNAIDLAWDIIARFASAERLREFYDNWVGVAAEEAEHFALLADRLAALGSAYGELPAHDGLWEAAAETSDDLLARLAVVPLVLEARGLDVTPEMILRLERAGDRDSAAILQRVYQDEIGHVAGGARWFERLCRARGLDPLAAFHDRVRRYFNGVLKAPFNRDARDLAGLAAGYYEPLAATVGAHEFNRRERPPQPQRS